MKKLEIYTGEKTYMFPNGKLATPEIVQSQYTAIMVFPHVIQTDEARQVMFAIENFSAMKSKYDIDSTLSDNEAIAALEEAINTPVIVEETISAEERIAAALEYQVMASLPDETEA